MHEDGGHGRRRSGHDIDAGMVIDGENLLLRSGPPLVNGAVVLPKLAEATVPRFYAPVFIYSAFVPSPFRFCTGPDRSETSRPTNCDP